MSDRWASVRPFSNVAGTVVKLVPPINKAIVLVVEDDSILRFLAVEFIEDAGFEAIEAESADDAIAILETRADVRIVFTDVDMPGGMDGLKLAAAVRDRWPPIEIVIVSGHPRKNTSLPDRAVFFPKPYDVTIVAATLHRMAAIV